MNTKYEWAVIINGQTQIVDSLLEIDNDVDAAAVRVVYNNESVFSRDQVIDPAAWGKAGDGSEALIMKRNNL